jgi:hypothetical protein
MVVYVGLISFKRVIVEGAVEVFDSFLELLVLKIC